MATTGYINDLLPFQGLTTLSRHCSWAGAQSALEKAGPQCRALYDLYEERGPLTDWEASEALGLLRSTINARRATLIADGLVKVHGIKPGRFGKPNSTWGLV